jgi:molecular chaperone HtpG
MKKILKDQVKDVVASNRLKDSPACIVADEKDPTVQMKHIMRTLGQDKLDEWKPILEINPTHEIVQKLIEEENSDVIQDVSWLLYEQAMLIEGEAPKNPTLFADRLNRVLTRSL